MRFLRARLTWLLYGGMALVALLPRLWQIDVFITPDETLFLDYARQFLRGLTSGDLRLTFGLGYPGVPVVWANSLGLWGAFIASRLGVATAFPPGLGLEQFLAGLDAQPLPYYAAARVGTAVLVTLLLLVVYALGRRLYGTKVALLSTLLLAFEPSMLGYSRLVHMSVPLALLMYLAIIAWLLWLFERRKRWLALTGVFCGMAILTITMGLLVPPALGGLALLVWLVERPGEWRQGPRLRAWLRKTIVEWLIAMAIAAGTFWALWPAMWIDPLGALLLTYDWLWKNAQAGFGNWGAFWMGSFVLDPGPGFYPLTLLLRMSPLMLIGLLANLATQRAAPRKAIEWSLWAYVVFFFSIMTFGSSKSVRYLLPPMAALAPLAGFGLYRLGQAVAGRVERMSGPALGAAFGMLLLGFSLPYAPYYLDYYNPLLLGWLWAPRAVQVGWGEGIDIAARYLDDKPNAAQMTVAAWYDRPFAPFFKGRTLPISGENAMRADYTVFYINQVQRNIPDPNLITYFERRQPEQAIRLGGIDYVWIYPAVSAEGPLPDGATPVNAAMGGRVALEGYMVRPAATGQGLNVTLYWRVLQSGLPDYFVYVRAIDGAGEIRARADSPPVMGFWPTSRWEKGRLVADEQVLSRPPETSPGAYRLEVGMYDPQTWAVLEPATGERGAGGGLLLGEVMLP
jgi:4-amino-4-deoxy-L-arabinose transferase-like glycosyltransferase